MHNAYNLVATSETRPIRPGFDLISNKTCLQALGISLSILHTHLNHINTFKSIQDAPTVVRID